jgi:hypothetical protein
MLGSMFDERDIAWLLDTNHGSVKQTLDRVRSTVWGKAVTAKLDEMRDEWFRFSMPSNRSSNE